MRIVIPSRERWDRQVTLQSISPRWRQRTTIVVGETDPQLMRYRVEYGGLILPVPVMGISATRQYVIDEFGDESILFIDDDMSFARRLANWHPDDNPYLGPTLTADETDRLFETLEYRLEYEGFAHVGVSHRPTNRGLRLVRWFRDNMRACAIFGVQPTVLKSIGFRFSDWPLQEDVTVTIELLRAGYPNRVDADYAYSQRVTNSRGGCSLYRTLEMQESAARLLAERFPGIVQLVTKKADWGSIQERVDVEVAWRKAMPHYKQTEDYQYKRPS